MTRLYYTNFIFLKISESFCATSSMIPLLFTILLVALVPTATSDESQGIRDHITIRIADKLMTAFDKKNYSAFEVFDSGFVFERCGGKEDMNAEDFMAGIKEYRNTLPSGTVINYCIYSIPHIDPDFDGVQFTLHIMYVYEYERHFDFLISLKRIRNWNQGSRWTWMKVSRCFEGDHYIITPGDMRKITLS